MCNFSDHNVLRSRWFDRYLFFYTVLDGSTFCGSIQKTTRPFGNTSVKVLQYRFVIDKIRQTEVNCSAIQQVFSSLLSKCQSVYLVGGKWRNDVIS
jgi:hypothetical protein